MHVETRSVGFLVEPQNQGGRFVSDLALKPLGRFFRFGHKTGSDTLLRFGLKTSGDDLLRFDLKTGGDDFLV
jgi:hypothetical protein